MFRPEEFIQAWRQRQEQQIEATLERVLHQRNARSRRVVGTRIDLDLERVCPLVRRDDVQDALARMERMRCSA